MSKASDLMTSLVAVFFVCAQICSAYPLNQTCSPPQSQSGTGYCGPSFCETSASTASACVFTSSPVNYKERISTLNAKSCVQSTDSRCTSAALAAVMVGQGIKAAYCNDAFLVIISDGTPGYQTNLDSIKNPPGAVGSDGSTCVTRTVNPVYMTVKIPLYPTLLSTADPNINNVNSQSFPNGPGDTEGAYMSTKTLNTAATYGLPTRGSVGISVGGQDIFPAFNNLAYLAPQKCEVDTCNEHVGGGGGQPHLHGDPFGTWCLYSALNYSSTYVHPPQIGWALDGPSIYGRHLHSNNYGYSADLDDCGGHIHGTYSYHYHTQVLTALTDNGAVKGQASGQSYYASTTGPYKCFKGDISKITNYFGNQLVSYTSVLPDTTTYMCSGTTKYYTASGIVLPNTASSTTSAPTVAPHGPSQVPTLNPSPSPTTATPSVSPTTATPTVSPTTATPTVSPTSAKPTLSPTTATPTTSPPTVAPTLAPVTFFVSQVVNNVVLDSTSKTAFEAVFTVAIASILSISSSNVVITSITTSTRRRLEGEDVLEMQQYSTRPFLQVSGGVVVLYTVTAPSTMASITTSLNSASSITALNSALAPNYPGASVLTASVNTPSPSKAPVSASIKTGSNIALSMILISLALLSNYH